MNYIKGDFLIIVLKSYILAHIYTKTGHRVGGLELFC